MTLKIYYLYTITDTLNNKVYVGQTVDFKRRWRDHQWLARNKQEQYIHRAMAKYGSHNFVFGTIACCWTQEDANEIEKLLIQQYDSRNMENGYNISPGGDPAWNTGLPKEQQPMYGKKQSDYQKQRMSEVHTGKKAPHSKECLKKMSEIFTGRILTEEWKEKIAVSNRGQIRTEETKQKISEASKNRKASEQTKMKISVAMTGKYSGENSYAAKLTWEIVKQIRIEYGVGNISQRELAKKYSVSLSTINQILKNRIWVVNA